MDHPVHCYTPVYIHLFGHGCAVTLKSELIWTPFRSVAFRDCRYFPDKWSCKRLLTELKAVFTRHPSFPFAIPARGLLFLSSDNRHAFVVSALNLVTYL